MAFTESLGQGMPLQGLLTGLELLAFVHMMISSQLPIPELHEKQVEFPGIHSSGGMRFRVDRTSPGHNSSCYRYGSCGRRLSRWRQRVFQARGLKGWIKPDDR